jgi:hypothetical protein
MLRGLMEYIIALWAVLVWKPFVKFVGESKAWLYAKRGFVIWIISGISITLAINLYGIMAYGPRQYFKELSIIYNKTDKELQRERQAAYKKQTAEKRNKIIQEQREKEAKENRR